MPLTEFFPGKSNGVLIGPRPEASLHCGRPTPTAGTERIPHRLFPHHSFYRRLRPSDSCISEWAINETSLPKIEGVHKSRRSHVAAIQRTFGASNRHDRRRAFDHERGASAAGKPTVMSAQPIDEIFVETYRLIEKALDRIDLGIFERATL